jgi:uncharacterized protein YuzE
MFSGIRSLARFLPGIIFRDGILKWRGAKNDVRSAIERPISVHQGQTSADRLFRGERFQSGFWKGNLPVVVVTYGGGAGLGFFENCVPFNTRTRRHSAMAKKLDNLSIEYDPEADVLYVSVGQPRPAITIEDRDGVLIRKDPSSGKPIAVTVLNYESRFRRLTDVSWLVTRELPSDLVDYLQSRPGF